MPRLRKVLLNKTVVFVTTSLEEGLLLQSNEVINGVLESSLARAQALHPVKICHFLFESTHVHLILVVNNPDDVPGFMERFKTESAHGINNLLGRDKHTVWCEGYDSPVVLTPGDVLRRIEYIYTNPSKDNLEETIDNYPGLSSWKMFRSGNHTKLCPWIRRRQIKKLPCQALTVSKANSLARKLKDKCCEYHHLTVMPNAWMECFGIMTPEDRTHWNTELVAAIYEKEQEYRKERKRAGKTVIGKQRLIQGPIDRLYQPQRNGRRMWCICSDVALRKTFINMVKALIGKARQVYERWKSGDFSLAFPLGLFAPSMPKLAEPLTTALFVG